MQAIRLLARAPRAFRPDVPGRRDAFVRDALERARTSEYALVGGSPRFRAVQRRRTRTASRVGFLLIAASAAFDAVVLFDRTPDIGPVLLVLNGAIALIALAACWALPGVLRHAPEPTAYAVTLLLILGTALTGFILPAVDLQTVVYLILFPGLIALILPWRTSTHLRWLLGYSLITMTYLAIGPSSRLGTDDRSDLIVVDLVAIGASLVGHVLLERIQIRSFAQLQRIQALRRRADADMAELTRVQHILEETARTDPLTGAGNRIRLAEDLRSARARMSRLGLRLGLVAIDLDRFKLVNDRFGHLAGDDVLRGVVRQIRGAIREEDAIYRFGGEEFLVLLRVPDGGSLATAAERIRACVEAAALPHPENPPGDVVTISLGGTLVGPDELGQSDDEWFATADAALYEAKARGRNRVVIAAA